MSAIAGDPTYGPAVSPITSIGGDPGNGVRTGELGAQASVETRKIDLHGYFLWNPRS